MMKTIDLERQKASKFYYENRLLNTKIAKLEKQLKNVT
jgi:hypothetical protein